MARLTEQRKKEIIKAYQRGDAVRQICRDYMTTNRTIQRVIRSAGITPRDKNKIASQQRLDRLRKERLAVQMHREGFRVWQIQRRTGIGVDHIMALISRDETENKPIEDIDKVRALMRAGWRIDDIAEEFQVTRQRAAEAMKIVLEAIREERETGEL